MPLLCTGGLGICLWFIYRGNCNSNRLSYTSGGGHLMDNVGIGTTVPMPSSSSNNSQLAVGIVAANEYGYLKEQLMQMSHLKW